MNTDVAWGIIGPGRIAQRFADALSVVSGSDLAAVGSRDRSRAEAFAAKFGAPQAFESYEDLAASDAVDAVYIATPHRYHFENALLCLEAGKHVLCEKPLTVNAGETQTLFGVARDRGLFLMEAMWTAFLPAYKQVGQWLESGAIGRPTVLTSTFGFRPPRDVHGRVLNPHLAGGALLDIGVYSIAVSRMVTGREPTGLDAHGFLGETGVDELTTVNLYYDENCISQFTATLLCDTVNRFAIYGPNGSIRIEPRFWESTRVILSVDGADHAVDCPFRHNGFEYQVEEAVSCIREGRVESALLPHATTLGTMQVMDEIRRRIGLTYPFEDPLPAS